VSEYEIGFVTGFVVTSAAFVFGGLALCWMYDRAYTRNNPKEEVKP
jgi:hypothetical protein